jgi:hypothetical protein
MIDEKGWEGEERRSIPIHIINHIDERLESHSMQVEGKLDDVRKEIRVISQSISSWMDKQPFSCDGFRKAIIVDCEKIVDEAIPTSPDNPSATASEKRSEHRRAHAKWIEDINDEMRRWKRIREKALEWAVIGSIGIVALAVWQFLLKGPQ